MKLRTKFFEKIEIAAPIFSKRPFMSDANFAQQLRMNDQLLDEILWRSSGKFPVEVDNEEVLDTQIADQRDFVRGGSEQMRCMVRPQHFERMWIERYDNRRSAPELCMTR